MITLQIDASTECEAPPFVRDCVYCCIQEGFHEKKGELEIQSCKKKGGICLGQTIATCDLSHVTREASGWY